MPTTKRKSKAADDVEQKQPKPSSNDGTTTTTTNNSNFNHIHNLHDALPFAQYTSTVAVHTSLLSFVALYLPRTAFLSDMTRPVWDPAQQSSRDKPQHPFLDQLTISPVSTLSWICLGVLFVQVSWGGWTRKWYVSGVLRGSEDEKRIQRVAYEGQKFKHLKDACVATFLASLAFHVILVLLGAPMTNCSTPFATGPDCPSDRLHLRTYLLSLLLALLTVSAPAYTLGVPAVSKNDSQSLVHGLLWSRLFAERSVRNSLERALVYPAMGTLMGSWIGAIPIALDWDRPWQAWPLTPAYGAIIGYIVASLVAFTATAVNLLAAEHIRAQAISETGSKTSSKLKPKVT